MLFTGKPQINMFAGWLYLVSRRYRQEVKDDWEALPSWAIAIQIAAGVASVIFPLIVVVLLAFVFVTRHV